MCVCVRACTLTASAALTHSGGHTLIISRDTTVNSAATWDPWNIDRQTHFTLGVTMFCVFFKPFSSHFFYNITGSKVYNTIRVTMLVTVTARQQHGMYHTVD